MNRQAIDSATHVLVTIKAKGRHSLSQEALVFRSVSGVTLYAGGVFRGRMHQHGIHASADVAVATETDISDRHME